MTTATTARPDVGRDTTDHDPNHLCCVECYPLPWEHLDYLVALCGKLANPREAPLRPMAGEVCAACARRIRAHQFRHLAGLL